MSGEWLLPAIGTPEAAEQAIEFAILAISRGPAVDPAEVTPELDETEQVVVALANLSALLLLVLKRYGLDRVALLERIRTHQRARADLAALDGGVPFDE